MGDIHVNVIIFGLIPKAALVISLGLTLIGVTPPLKRIMPLAVIQGIASYYIILNTEYAVSILLQYIIMCILSLIILRIPIYMSSLGILIGNSINRLTEGIIMIIIPTLFRLSLAEIMSRSWVVVGMFLPQLVILFILNYLSIKYNFTLENEINFLNKDKAKKI